MPRPSEPPVRKPANPIGVWSGQCTPSGIRCHYRPFIEDVDDRLPDLIQERDLCQTYPLDKGLFSDTGLHLSTRSL